MNRQENSVDVSQTNLGVGFGMAGIFWEKHIILQSGVINGRKKRVTGVITPINGVVTCANAR